jgi:glycosyltransferase involved in cell wall biosynthesis
VFDLDAVTVVVPTTGPTWGKLAQRAVESATSQGVTVIETLAPTLQAARNEGLARVRTPFVVHLDADDVLTPTYFEQMIDSLNKAFTTRAVLRAIDCTDLVIAPLVSYVRPGRNPDAPYSTAGRSPAAMPRVPGHDHECFAECLPYGNWLVVGALAGAALLRRVGGWRDFPVYEDWDLWLRCYLNGATFARSEAVYEATVSPGSRNRSAGRDLRERTHHDILRANGLTS